MILIEVILMKGILMNGRKLPASPPSMKEDADGYTKLPNQILEGLILILILVGKVAGSGNKL